MKIQNVFFFEKTGEQIEGKESATINIVSQFISFNV